MPMSVADDPVAKLLLNEIDVIAAVLFQNPLPLRWYASPSVALAQLPSPTTLLFTADR